MATPTSNATATLKKATADQRKELEKFLDTRRVKLMKGIVGNTPSVEGGIKDEAVVKQFSEELASIAHDWLKVRGLKSAVIVELTPEELSLVPLIAPTVQAEQHAVKENTKPKAETITTPVGNLRKGSIVAAVYEMYALPVDQALTKDQMVKRLAEMFPDHLPDAMATTVTGRAIAWRKEFPEFKLGRDELGRMNIHIEGWCKSRAVSPEQAELNRLRDAARALRAQRLESTKEERAAAIVKRAASAEARKATLNTRLAEQKAKLEARIAKAAEDAKKAEEAIAKLKAKQTPAPEAVVTEPTA